MTKNSFIGLLAIAVIALLVGIWVGSEKHQTIDSFTSQFTDISVQTKGEVASEVTDALEVVEGTEVVEAEETVEVTEGE